MSTKDLDLGKLEPVVEHDEYCEVALGWICGAGCGCCCHRRTDDLPLIHALSSEDDS